MAGPTFFTQHGLSFPLQASKKTHPMPFHDHPQFPALIDTLIRKNNHHLILQYDFPSSILTYFLDALSHYFLQEHIPAPLRESEILYLDLSHLSFSPTEQIALERDFFDLRLKLDRAEKYYLIAFPARYLLKKSIPPQPGHAFLQHQLLLLAQHPCCRILGLTQAKKINLNVSLRNQFTCLDLFSVTETDRLSILKLQRNELENYHQVSIPDEMINLAYSLSERYLSADNALEKALLLLDSCAARAYTHDVEDSSTIRALVTPTDLLNVLSTWTQIPVSHLQLNTFKSPDFIYGMQQRIFGQDSAITLLSHELQQSQVHLQQSTGPFCSLLFCGPKHSGKKTVAIALAEQLFKQRNALYCAEITPANLHSLLQVKLQRSTDKKCFSLPEIIHTCPYAIFFFEDIDQLPAAVLDGLYEILSTGHLHDAKGKQHDFRQAIFILTTTCGTERLLELMQSSITEEESPETNIMQIIMNENHDGNSAGEYSPQELANEIAIEINQHLPPSLCQYLRVIPFLPLTLSAIEHIIRLKLKLLSKLLDSRHGIEFGYAPEVIRYLANDDHAMGIDKALKLLYFTIEQAILSQAENKNRPNQLFLQLNETGQLLRCDWLMMTTSLKQQYS